MKRVVQAMRLTFISAALIGTSGLPVFRDVPSALAANKPTPYAQVFLERPSSVTVGSALVRCSTKKCDQVYVAHCIELSQPDKPYDVGPFVSGTPLTITRWVGAQCQGKRNPQDQQATIQGPTRRQTITIENW